MAHTGDLNIPFDVSDVDGDIPAVPEPDADTIDKRFYGGDGQYSGRTLVDRYEVWRYYLVEGEDLKCTTVFDLEIAEVEFNSSEWKVESEDSSIGKEESIRDFCERHFKKCDPQEDHQMCVFLSREYRAQQPNQLSITDKKTGGRVILH